MPKDSFSGEASFPSIFPKKTASPKTLNPEPPKVLLDALLPGMVLEGFRVLAATPRSATIMFPAQKGVLPEELVFRRREFEWEEEEKKEQTPAVDKKTETREELRVRWVRIEPSDVKAKRVGSNIEVHLRGLPPGQTNYVDLLGPPNAKGERTRLYVAEITNPPAHEFLAGRNFWTLGTVGSFLLLGVVYTLRRRAK
jgi:hypothetical protein